ncbi:hypothetical protein FRC14_003565 [Serendipita sp. 396]|nr:hypothetical protein FRC14_003565 [Serendipita sp. 396]KAG8788232.1 hypothetical protein FRC15_005402 [Serendipita sp. 397]KAG8803436.1 hypothetical protein FRC16_005368 [Serendipita sp. 398]KAG8827055.1 hypothetical protein FRC19_005759 [Serendipita sp. 401]KAG8860234.1 hypothetical protein FRB91_004318 [Serendipita sp. 411]KAG8874373.1 hypothetical protein FRC20_006139 [Serendipita sp. 405]
MGSRLSKQSEPEQPQLYVVPTPHPTLQYIYPVYAAPIDASKQQEKKGRSSPLARRGDKLKARQDIPFVEDDDGGMPPNGAGTGPNDDGAWYHFHVDAAGDVDYIRPGTTLPTAFAMSKPYDPHFDGSMTPAMSMAGPESYHMAPGYHATYQGFYHPQPQRVSHSEAFSGVSTPYPRARSVSPVQSRAITPLNTRPRRATTPTPKGSKMNIYDPAPPVPQDIRPIANRRFVSPISKGQKTLPSTPGSVPTEVYHPHTGREYRSERRGYREETRVRSPDLSRTNRRPSGSSSQRASTDEETTAISSNAPHDAESAVVHSNQSRPYNLVDEATYQSHTTRASSKHNRYYPSPGTTNVHSPRFEAQYSRGRD